MKELEQFKKEMFAKRKIKENWMDTYECVAISKAWADYIWIPTGSFHGSAYNWWLKDMKWWERVEKSQWLKPNPWDILFWDKTKSNPYWHTSICTREGGRLFLTHLEQNGGRWSGTGEWSDAIRERRTTYYNLLWWKTQKKSPN